MTSQDTIFALSSAPGRAGVSVVRLSGPEAREGLKSLIGGEIPEPRRATLARFSDPDTGEPIDEGIALWFPGPHSFTGEDVAEFQVHGGRAVVDALLTALGGMTGLRPAEPGEFTRRAFDRGKLDLTAAEGLADLINAETEAQRRQALRQMDGELAAIYDGWRDRLTRALAHYEAAIDFPDEDLPPEIMNQVSVEIEALATEMEFHLKDDRRGEILRDGYYIVVVGAPNVGKSSIVNALARRDAAITSDVAGTTRDVIEVHMDLGGYPVIVADTAGIREFEADSEGEIEREGVRRALERAERADLRLVVFDLTEEPAKKSRELVDENSLVVINKADRKSSAAFDVQSISDKPYILSAKTGLGLDVLIDAIRDRVADMLSFGGPPALTRIRHRQALEEAQSALARSRDATLPELAAEDLRLASRAVGRITGAVDIEDLLDIIFREFCIGK